MVYRVSMMLVIGVFVVAWAAAGDVPVPPMQGKPWTEGKSEKLAALRSAVEASFASGLADPRGCEWREVTVSYYDPVGPRTIKTTGWVLPAGDDPDAPRYAITWDGMVHPVVTLGPPARMTAADLKAASTVGVGYCCLHADPSIGLWRFEGEDIDESQYHIDPKWEVFALLWRAGEVEMAEAYAKVCDFEDPDDGGRDSHWPRNLLAQAVGAFNVQDDAEARRHFNRLLPIMRAAGENGRHFGFHIRVNADLINAALAAIEARTEDKLSDEMRWLRAQFAATEWLTYSMVAERLPDVEARQALYMDYLPMVSAADRDNLVILLAAEGRSIVPQLMHVLRHDKRLCGERDIFWMPTFGRGAAGIAEAALQAIYVTVPEFDDAAAEVQEVSEAPVLTANQIADAWAAFLARHGDQSPQERWRAVMADDDAGITAWKDVGNELWMSSAETHEPRLPTYDWKPTDDLELMEVCTQRVVQVTATGNLALLKWTFPWSNKDAIRRLMVMPDVSGDTRQAMLQYTAKWYGVAYYDDLAAVLREQRETDPNAYESFARHPNDRAAVAAITWLVETEWPDRPRLQAAVMKHAFLRDFPLIRVRLIDYGLDPDPPPGSRMDNGGGWGF